MASKEEIREVVEWCKKRKAESKVTPIIEMNPFREKFTWMLARIKIAIDLPLEEATKEMAVYDSPTDRVYISVGGKWLQVEPDDIFEV